MGNRARDQYRPDFVPHPGLTIAELLGERGLTQAEFAAKSGFTQKHVVDLVQGRVRITEDSALRLQRLFSLPVEFWMNRQAMYDAHKTREKAVRDQRMAVDWAKSFPYKKMSDRGWVPPTRSRFDRVENLLNFFGIGGLNSLTETGPPLVARLRTTARQSVNPHHLHAWLRQGEILGRDMECGPYDKRAFTAALTVVKSLTRKPIDEGYEKARSTLADCGVAVVLVEQLPKTPYGATRWLSKNKALMQLSLRGKSDDHFWFTFFHEAAHILQHGKRDVFIEGKGMIIDDLQQEEAEADSWASEFLIPKRHYAELIKGYRRPSKAALNRFAERIGIAPGIVVGRLQHDKIIPKNWHNDLKTRVDLPFDVTRS
jgi:HTH-type transcriptional regulator / antitoxin HigA